MSWVLQMMGGLARVTDLWASDQGDQSCDLYHHHALEEELAQVEDR